MVHSTSCVGQDASSVLYIHVDQNLIHPESVVISRSRFFVFVLLLSIGKRKKKIVLIIFHL